MVHLPPNFNLQSQRALVISLHGGSGNMMNAQGFSMLNPVADQNNFVVAWPQGFGIAPPGFSWADGRNTSADQAGIDDVGFINKLTDTLVARYQIDTNRIYLCGFSNGGFMVQRMACQSSGRFAAMASLGASMDTFRYQTCNPTKPIPMAFFNGTADPAMPFLGGPLQNPLVIPVVPVDSAVRFWVNQNQCQTSLPVFNFPDTFPSDSSTAQLFRYTNGLCSSEVLFYKLINGGHTWPGVYVAAQASVLGNTNRDLNASVELWNFFNQHPLCNAVAGLEANSETSSVSIYPNPTKNIVYIEVSQQVSYQVIIRTTLGQIIQSFSSPSQMDIAHLQSGLYLLSVQLGEKSIHKRLLKQ
jgi:polyhydroxybutyrate depolymerase